MKELIKVVAHITNDQRIFLETIVFEDGASSIGGKVATEKGGNAVQWCIDACMRIEKLYGIDALYVGYNDIRQPQNQP